ncbi:hypothetical protein NPIL_468011 [Nephila pilipes]|uniref:Uncharacterized protein n=1 Tax=Nephila pilipes TaxID=299642 RepID=A0A8X6NWN6_NEPPI|nr:hypothetical protein NPIL_468011 [Nephila pilipes]
MQRQLGNGGRTFNGVHSVQCGLATLHHRTQLHVQRKLGSTTYNGGKRWRLPVSQRARQRQCGASSLALAYIAAMAYLASPLNNNLQQMALVTRYQRNSVNTRRNSIRLRCAGYRARGAAGTVAWRVFAATTRNYAKRAYRAMQPPAAAASAAFLHARLIRLPYRLDVRLPPSFLSPSINNNLALKHAAATQHTTHHPVTCGNIYGVASITKQ